MFADILRTLRKAKGLTQAQLAELIGVERSSIGKYEGNSCVLPSDDVKIRIADLFNVSVDYLLGREETNKFAVNLLKDEETLIEQYRNLNEQGREYIRQTMYMATSIYKHHNVSDLENQTIG